MKRKILSMTMGMIMAASLTGCGAQKAPEQTSTPQPTETTATSNSANLIGDNVKFDPDKKINNGNPVDMEFWIWDSPEMFQALIDEYKEARPNVNIKLVTHPWEDYWTKLPLALNSKKGPAVFAVHNSQHENLINYMAPYDINLDELRKDFVGVDAHVIDNQVYYVDYGIMTGCIYYNKDLWKEAGLTDKDIPVTWGQFEEVSKKLTKADAAGKITQAGFNYNKDYQSMIMGLNYQQGELLFKEDGKTPNIDHDAMKKNTQFLVDLYNKDKVGSKDFGVDAGESFGQGQSAMVYKWGWYNNFLQSNYPDIQYGVFELPTPTEEEPFAYDRYNGESTMGVNKAASNEQQEAAQDFVRFFLSNDNAIKQFCTKYSVFPSKVALKEDKDILAHPVSGAIAPHIEKYIWPGPIPNVIEDTLKATYEEVMYNNMPIDEAVAKAQAQMEKDMRDSEFQSVEKQYKFISDKK